MLLKKNLLLGIIFIFFAANAIACSSPVPSEGNSPVIISSGSECSIIYSKSSSDYVVRQARNLGTQIEEYCESFVTLSSDWAPIKNSDTIEILFGYTNRPESIRAYEELPETGYIIREDGGKIVIAATSEKLLNLAAHRFFTEYSSLNTGISVPEKFEIKESDFSFFNIACNGSSDTNIIVPDNSSSEVISLANYAAEQINKKCNTQIKVLKHSETESLKNSIFICNDDKYLSNNKSNISYMNDCLNLRGSDESSTLNALSLFIDHIIHSCDKKEDGIYQIYFPMDEVIENEWKYSVPVFTCGNFIKSESVTNNSYSLSFSEAVESDYRNYLEILKIVGFVPQSSNESSGTYTSVFKKESTEISVTYSKEHSSVTLLISGKVFAQE